jgi:hypothetical protein
MNSGATSAVGARLASHGPKADELVNKSTAQPDRGVAGELA